MRWHHAIRELAIICLVMVTALCSHSKVTRAENREVAGKLNAELVRHFKAGQFARALNIGKRAVTVTENTYGPNHANLAAALNNLALVHTKLGNLDEAEALYKRSLAIRKSVLGADHPWFARALNNMAEFLRVRGRFGDAEALLKRSIGIYESKLGPKHVEVANAYNNLAGMLDAQGRYGEAEPLYKRALAIREATLGPDHIDVAASLNNLASLYESQEKLSEAEIFYRRALKIREDGLGGEHPTVAIALNNLAGLLDEKGQYKEAQSLYKRSLTIREKVFGSDHPDVGTVLSNLAALYRKMGRLDEADQLYRRALTNLEGALGPDHPRLGAVLSNLGHLRGDQRRFRDAKRYLERALQIRRRLGPYHPDVGATLNNLAWVHLEQGDFQRAADYWEESATQVIRRMARGLGRSEHSAVRSEAVRQAWKFHGLIKMSYRISARGTIERVRHAREMFEIAQWAQFSRAAQSIAKMVARSAASTPELARLVRERQDLIAEWQANDQRLTLARGQSLTKRDRKTEKTIAERLAGIEKRVSEVDDRLARDFPDYAALTKPAPVSVAEVQGLLADDEALIVFLDTTNFESVAEETFVWVVTRSDIRWVSSKFGTAALMREVGALRCGLDATAWHGQGGLDCLKLLGLKFDEAPKQGALLPYDATRAHVLYRTLFADVEELFANKKLIVVPSGPLTQLPPQVLVSEAPHGNDYRSIAWLAKRHAISVLPAVSALKSLRRTARPSQATKPIIGFGNPVLDGPDARYAKRAAEAKARQHCGPSKGAARSHTATTADMLSRGVAAVATRQGLADIASIKQQVPLPETADELCTVARQLSADPNEISLGARATELRVKSLSAGGELAQYRTIHFATHGTLAGQLDGTTEPGLILTPPTAASKEDDGYLSGSEIANLKLDADWVILSACNTAGGADDAQTETLSGLAQAFFYAGAGALLVSHWEVYSDATVQLITKSVGAIADNDAGGHAEALRHAMLDMIKSGKPHEAHPSYWAPFTVVGDGGAASR